MKDFHYSLTADLVCQRTPYITEAVIRWAVGYVLTERCPQLALKAYPSFLQVCWAALYMWHGVSAATQLPTSPTVLRLLFTSFSYFARNNCFSLDGGSRRLATTVSAFSVVCFWVYPKCSNWLILWSLGFFIDPQTGMATTVWQLKRSPCATFFSCSCNFLFIIL